MHRAVKALWRSGFVVACVLAATACGGGDDDDEQPADDTGAAGSGCDTAADAATFTEVYEMMFPRATNAHCDMCHGLPPNEISNGNLSVGMDKASAYAALVGKTSPATARCPSASLVVACKPDESLLLLKLSDPPPCGDRMPVGGMALSQDQLGRIRSWIAAGAKDN